VSDEGGLSAIPWEQVAAGASALGAGTRITEMAARFLGLVESWASPSAVLCAYRDPSAPEGVRMVPELTSGSVTTAAERSLAKLFTDYPPDAITRPTLLAPAEGAAGMRVRDTLVIPWSQGASASGFLVLRGLPRPQPANLGDAVSLLAQALWSRLGLHVAPASEVDAARTGIETRLRELGRVVEHVEADWRAVRSAGEAETDRLNGELAALRGQVESLQKAVSATEQDKADAEAAGKARAQAEAERDAARSEATELRGRIETAQREADSLRGQVESLQKAASATEQDKAAAQAAAKGRAQAEAERDAARNEATELRGRIETTQRELDGLRGQVDSLQKAASATEQDKAAAEAAAKGRAQAETERDAARSEATELRGRIETVQRELDTLRAQAHSATAGTEAAGKALAQAEAERDSARGDAAELRGRIETALREREEARAALTTAAGRHEKADADTHAAVERGQRAIDVFMNGFEAIRRTPFVPPTVRVWVDEARALLGPKSAPRPRLGRILLLDREAPMLSTLAGELELAGLDVLIAHHPDEVSLFMKTPDAVGLTALVLDVLALRPDQNMAELVRAWRHDLPGLVLFLTFRAENPNEAERAQRLPVTATAGYLPRPLQKAALLDAVASLARRTAKR
jgi:predicted  nucleic acid-binding Zn-ribbon protein